MHKEMLIIYIGLAMIGAAFFFMLGYYLRKYYAKKQLKNAEERARKTLENAKNEAERIRREAGLEEKEKLQRVSGMTRDEARQVLLKRLEDEVKQEAAVMIKRTEEEAKEKADKEARKIIGLAIQRCAAEHAVETTVSVVNLPSDEMKGRIIGREGRNIRALETATGVDIIIDDTPEENLIADGRIHPGRIEEVVEKAKKEIENKIKEEGEKAAFDLGIHDMHPELLKLVGKLKYRTSFGQNGLQHTKEVAQLMGVMATQLGLDAGIDKRAGLLHDIGKVVSQEMEEGTHAIVGGTLARKYGEPEDVAKAEES